MFTKLFYLNFCFSVIRIILQFLKESNLRRSLYCLQEESGVSLQCVDSLEGFRMDVMVSLVYHYFFLH
jgi:hypothetical protein